MEMDRVREGQRNGTSTVAHLCACGTTRTHHSVLCARRARRARGGHRQYTPEGCKSTRRPKLSNKHSS